MGVRVVVAEDNYLIREGIRALLDADDELELVADAASLPVPSRLLHPPATLGPTSPLR